MRNDLKQAGPWIRIALILAVLIFTAGKISQGYEQLCKRVDAKLDKEIYNRDQQALRREITLQLQRIEEKIDALNSIPKDPIAGLRN